MSNIKSGEMSVTSCFFQPGMCMSLCRESVLPDSFSIASMPTQVTLHEARDLPVWGFPWQSNPYCRITLGAQAVQVRCVLWRCTRCAARGGVPACAVARPLIPFPFRPAC